MGVYTYIAPETQRGVSSPNPRLFLEAPLSHPAKAAWRRQTRLGTHAWLAMMQETSWSLESVCDFGGKRLA